MPYRTPITSYRILPTKWRIIYPEDSSTPGHYMKELDRSLGQLQNTERYEGQDDLVSAVFANQTLAHEFRSQHLAELIQERRTMAQKHLGQIDEHLEKLREQRPLQLRYAIPTSPQQRQTSELERQILDLEKQKRDVQLTLWRDTLELRQTLLGERQEYHQGQRRMRLLLLGEDQIGPN